MFDVQKRNFDLKFRCHCVHKVLVCFFLPWCIFENKIASLFRHIDYICWIVFNRFLCFWLVIFMYIFFFSDWCGGFPIWDVCRVFGVYFFFWSCFDWGHWNAFRRLLSVVHCTAWGLGVYFDKAHKSISNRCRVSGLCTRSGCSQFRHKLSQVVIRYLFVLCLSIRLSW